MQSKNALDDSNFRPAMLWIKKSDMVSYLVGQQVAAIGMITFVRDNRYHTKYRNVTAGANKVLFKIETVLIKSTKPLIKCSLFLREFTL